MPKKNKPKKILHGRVSFKKYGPFNTFINILIGYIDSVVLLNVFFLATSIGIITLGASIASVYDCYEDLTMNRNEHRYSAYFKHFKKNFTLTNALLGLIYLTLNGLIVYLILFYILNLNSHIFLTIPFILTVFVLFYIQRFYAYYFLQNSRMQLDTKTKVKNSIYFASTNIKNALLGDLGFTIFIIVPAVFFEYTFLLFFILSFSASMLTSMMSIYSIVNQFVLQNSNEDPSDIKEDKPNLKLDLIDKKNKKSHE